MQHHQDVALPRHSTTKEHYHNDAALENAQVWTWVFMFTIMIFEWTYYVLKFIGKLWAYVSSYPFIAVLSSSYLFMLVYRSGLDWRNYAACDVTQTGYFTRPGLA